MTLSFFITVIPDHDKPQPPGCLLESKTSAFNLWCQNHQELVDAITQQDGENSFLNSLKSTLSRKFPLSDKQLTVAARILGM
ncbi:TPA: hypothetical protein ISC71_003857 [Escherichia coli]|nr:hypothetical protein [Escherichia coli]